MQRKKGLEGGVEGGMEGEYCTFLQRNGNELKVFHVLKDELDVKVE